MSNENINNEEDFKDFADIPDNIDIDADIAQIDEEAVEKALKHIANQMLGGEDNANAIPAEQEAAEEQPDEKKEDELMPDEGDKAEAQDIEEAKETEDSKDETIESKESVFEDSKDEEDKAETPENKIDEDETKDSENDKKESENKIPESNLELSQWEELNEANDVVKKYIVYISKDFVPVIDEMSVDERSAYINDAIQQKIDTQDEQRQTMIRRSAIIHFIIVAIVIIAITPLGLILANKAIMATFDNYKYSQDNFEKLYKHRFEKNKAYMRSLEYNKELEKKVKSEK